MTIKSDKWIKEMSEKHEMIKPFESGQIRVDQNNQNLFPMVHLLTVMMLDVQMSLRFLLTFILQK